MIGPYLLALFKDAYLIQKENQANYSKYCANLTELCCSAPRSTSTKKAKQSFISNLQFNKISIIWLTKRFRKKHYSELIM